VHCHVLFVVMSSLYILISVIFFHVFNFILDAPVDLWMGNSCIENFSIPCRSLYADRHVRNKTVAVGSNDDRDSSSHVTHADNS